MKMTRHPAQSGGASPDAALRQAASGANSNLSCFVCGISSLEGGHYE